MLPAGRRSAWHWTWLTCFSSKLTPARELYDDFGYILIVFPGWNPAQLSALTVKKRRYWARWSEARYERMTDG